MNNNGKIEIMNKKSELNCNNVVFEVFGQNDVINTYLTGIDEKLENQLYDLIKIIMNPTENELSILKAELKRLLAINKRKMLKNIASFPPDDIYDLMINLIKSTEIKNKLVSQVDSVGGDVSINEITKYKGIQEKRKIYK